MRKYLSNGLCATVFVRRYLCDGIYATVFVRQYLCDGICATVLCDGSCALFVFPVPGQGPRLILGRRPMDRVQVYARVSMWNARMCVGMKVYLRARACVYMSVYLDVLGCKRTLWLGLRMAPVRPISASRT